MKTPALIAMCGFLLANPASAQTVSDQPALAQEAVWRSLPDFRVETSSAPDSHAIIEVLDARLVPHLVPPASRDLTVDFEFLKQPTSSLDSGRMASLQAAYQKSTENLTDSREIARIVSQEAREQPERVCETVGREVTMHPACACEIVKAAIEASEADDDLAVEIAEHAIMASPEKMRLISQCAIAQAPGATQRILSLLAKLDPNAGETATSAKDAKSSMIASQPSLTRTDGANPLDRLTLAIATPDPVIPAPVSAVDP